MTEPVVVTIRILRTGTRLTVSIIAPVSRLTIRILRATRYECADSLITIIPRWTIPVALAEYKLAALIIYAIVSGTTIGIGGTILIGNTGMSIEITDLSRRAIRILLTLRFQYTHIIVASHILRTVCILSTLSHILTLIIYT